MGGEHIDTDSTGATLEYTLYLPYGAILKTSGTTGYSDINKFTGKPVDKDTGFYYYGARYYSTNLGRFLSEDPVFLSIGSQSSKSLTSILRDPQMLDSYSYGRDNPVNMVDRDGRWSFSWASLSNIGVTALIAATTAITTAAMVMDLAAPFLEPAFAAGGSALIAEETTMYSSTVSEDAAAVESRVMPGNGGTTSIHEENTSTTKSNNGWGRPETLEKHFNDHGADFSASSPSEYTSQSQDFYGDGLSDAHSGIETHVTQDGTIKMYQPSTNTFGAYNSDGSTKTFFKPTAGADYWKRQITK